MRVLLVVLMGLAVQPARAFTYEDLKALIESRNLTRIEEVIPQLPAEYQENYTLMHNSRSLQGASPTAPRAILYGKDAKLIMTFTGDKNLNGYDSMEVIQYRPQSHVFEFHRIVFPEGDATKTVEFSPPNPGVCMGCHTNRLRPNWERYPEWPGAYGSFDDYPQKEELANLKIFWEKHAGGRYQSLKRLPGSEASPYEIKSRGRLRFRPNFKLQTALFSYQAESIAHSLLQVPHAKKFALLYAMSRLKCTPADPVGPTLQQLYGDAAIQPLWKWEAPTPESAYAFLLRAAKFTPKKFSTELVVPVNDPELAPFFFHNGVPKDYKEPFANGVIELTDLVMTRLLDHWVKEIPELKPHLVDFRWIEDRFKVDALSIPLAREMDDLMQLRDYAYLKTACPILVKAYRE